MNPTRHPSGPAPSPGGAVAFVLDGEGTVLQCTGTVLDLTGYSADEVRGGPAADLVVGPAPWSRPPGGAPAGPWTVRTVLRHRNGTPVQVDAEVLPLSDGPEARFLLCAAPSVVGQRWTEDRALIRALFNQSRIGLSIHGTDLVAVRTNLSPECFGVPGAVPGDRPPRVTLEEALVPEDAAAVRERLRLVLDTGEPLIDWEHSARRLRFPERERVLSLSAFRLQDSRDRVIGIAVVYTDVTEQFAARRRLALLHAAATRLGQTLDLARNAEELVGILVPDFADLASVDLVEAMFQGQEPKPFAAGIRQRRTAVASADGVWPAGMYPRGQVFAARETEDRLMPGTGSILLPDLRRAERIVGIDESWRRLAFPETAASALIVPLWARGHVLGLLGLWRTRDRLPFAESDVPLAEEIGSRAALSLENARRYTAELRTVESLQRSLLPPEGADLGAAESAGSYVPAGTAAGLGGCWYDVIPLSSARVAFVIGDVAGHGLAATATMGRLRTAVQTLADLDLSPEELLTHLDDLVVRLSATEPQPDR
ncbi:protein phosphatase, partial [Streptomyces carminius]